MDAIGIIGNHEGILIHSGWLAYYSYKGKVHALCNAHHIRELSGAEEEGQKWAGAMISLLLTTNEEVGKAGGKLTEEGQEQARKKYRRILQGGEEECPLPQSPNDLLDKFLFGGQLMKKLLFFFILAQFGIYANAQIMQKGTYNDGKVLVYIEQKDHRGGVGDALYIKNISDREIIVNISYKSIRRDDNGSFLEERMIYRMIYREETLEPSQVRRPSYYISGGGYFYVDSFAILNVQYANIPQNNKFIKTV
jgi:hypothetical protein